MAITRACSDTSCRRDQSWWEHALQPFRCFSRLLIAQSKSKEDILDQLQGGELTPAVLVRSIALLSWCMPLGCAGPIAKASPAGTPLSETALLQLQQILMRAMPALLPKVRVAGSQMAQLCDGAASSASSIGPC